MIQRVTITLTPAERMALERLARRDLREPKDFVRLLIRDAAIARGLLPSDAAQDTPAQEAPPCAPSK